MDNEEKIFAGLNPEQKEAVSCLEGPLLVMAGAGSGKTKVLTCRIANLLAHGVQPYNILAITFTNKAANEMKSRAEKMIGESAKKVWLSTFHSFCAKLLRFEIEVTGTYKKNYLIYDTTDSQKILNDCVAKLNLDAERFKHAAAAISSLKNKLIDAAKYREMIFNKVDSNDFERNLVNVYELYEKKMIEINALDFDDLIFVMVKIFRDHPEILEKYQERFKYILIDEYQDTNMAQYILTKYLVAKYKNICVVGDADQSIYGWRGADMQNILNFEEDYPKAKVILLEQNYRSTKTIIQAANGVIENNVNRKEKVLWTDNETGSKINFIHCLSDRAEAAFIAREIRRLVTYENVQYKEIAILYRTNAQSRAFEEKFMQTDIPYIIVGGIKFYERKEIKDILAYLRLIENPHDDISFLRVVNVPRRGIGPINLERLTAFAAERDLSIFDVVISNNLLEQVPQLSPKCKQKLREFALMLVYFSNAKDGLTISALVQAVLKESGYLAALAETEDSDKPENVARVENLSSFVNGTKEFDETTENPTLEDFLNHVALVADIDSLDEENSRVSLMTIHSAKGLEFPIVFVAGLEEGLLPHSNSMIYSNELEEERRACYVAMTRAEKKLYLTAAAERRTFGRSYESHISRFVAEVPQEIMSSFSERNPGSSNFLQSIAAIKNSANKNFAASSRESKLSKLTAPKTTNVIEWKVGDKVKHQKWGVGTVMAIDGNTLTINFANPEIGEKKLKAAVAPISKA